MNEKVPNPARVASLYLVMQTGERQLTADEMAELETWAQAGSANRLKMLQEPLEKFSEDISAAVEKEQAAFEESLGQADASDMENELFHSLPAGNQDQVRQRVFQVIFGDALNSGSTENHEEFQRRSVATSGMKSIFRRENWRWMVAASIFGIGLAAFLIEGLSKRSTQVSTITTTTTDSVYKPGLGRAMLTSGDGQQIELGKNGLDTLLGGSMVQADSFSITYKNIHQDNPTLNTLTTSLGGMFQATLPDGTLVWLNAGSRLQYPTYFSGDQRGVSLIGEAYFEVAKNAKKPFVVQTGEFSVEVKGTHFNIRAYQTDPQLRTTLLEGSVVVTKGNQSVQLEPGYTARVFRETPDYIRREKADVDGDLAWKNGEFYFRSTPLRDALREIGEWYNIQIDLQETENIVVNMVIARTEPMEKVLKTLMLSTGCNYEIVNGSVKVKSKHP